MISSITYIFGNGVVAILQVLRETVGNILDREEVVDQEDQDSILSEQDDKDDNDGESITSSASAACSNLSSVTGRPKYRKRQR